MKKWPRFCPKNQNLNLIRVSNNTNSNEMDEVKTDKAGSNSQNTLGNSATYYRDLPQKSNRENKESLMDSESPNMGGVGKEVKGRTHTYYQVLIDGRDSPYITHRTQNESVTFLGNHSENTRYVIVKHSSSCFIKPNVVF